jgi:two-component system, LytTR family, response regulator
MTFIALDDEPIALAIIQKYARNLPGAELLATFTDAVEAADYLQKNSVDLLISDINMPDVNGLQFVRDLAEDRPMVIFMTAYKEHAHEGFDLDVVDYLVKPVAPARFQKALQKAADLLDLRRRAEILEPSVPSAEDHFFVFSNYVQVKIIISDILYLESMGDYIKIHLATQTKPVHTLDRLKNFAARLKSHDFRRVHRSFLVNGSKIVARQKSKICVAGVWIPVGETYYR